MVVQPVIGSVGQREMPRQERLIQRLALGVILQFVTVPLWIRSVSPYESDAGNISFTFSPDYNHKQTFLGLHGAGSHRVNIGTKAS